MKIVTVNIPESYDEAIQRLTGEGGLYPSRSELIRVAVREFLLKELRMAKAMDKYKLEEGEEEFDPNLFVRVPLEDSSPGGKEFKTYKILRRLEY